MSRFLFLIGTCLIWISLADVLSHAQRQCPPCYKDRLPMAGHEAARDLPRKPDCYCGTADCPGCSDDNRRVIKIRFDTDPSATWVHGPDGMGGVIVEPRVYHAVRCAMSKWHRATGSTFSGGQGVPFFFIIDQDAADADIVIRKETPAEGGYASISRKAEPPYTLKLSPDILQKSDDDNCGRTGHELGHAMNAGGAEGCGQSIMSGLSLFGNRYSNNVTAGDVDAVRRNFFDSERVACAKSYLTDTGESVDDGGGGCGPAAESACYDNGGTWDSAACYCDYGCDPYGWQQQDCTNGGGFWNPGSCTCEYSCSSAEYSCYQNGGTWDANSCTCSYGGCDPGGSQQANCEARGDTWDPINCMCNSSSVCVLGDPEFVETRTESTSSCSGSGDVTDCIDEYSVYIACPDVSTPTCQCSEWEQYERSDCRIYGGNCDW